MKNVRAVTFEKTRRQAYLVATFVVVGAFILGGYGIYGIVRSSNLSKPQAAVTYPQVVAGASTTAVSPYSVDVHGTRWVTDASGATYLSVVVSVHNTSQQEQQFSPLLQTRVVDSAGMSHDFTAVIDPSPMGGPIAADGTAAGTLSYRLNQQDSLPAFYFAQSPGGPEAVVSLK